MTKKSKNSTKKKPSLKDKITELESVVKDEKDKFLRLFAEFENYKRRTSKERLELYKTASMELMTSLLPIIDDLERASAEFSRSKDKQLTEGFSIIKNKFNETLKSQGLSEIEVKSGDDFDVEKHEAITQITAQSNKMKGKVVDVTEKGFKLGEKIIRYPKVVVGK